MSTQYTTPRSRPFRRWFLFLIDFALPLLLIGATVNAWADGRSHWFYILFTISDMYILSRIAHHISKSHHTIIVSAIASVQYFLVGIYMTSNFRSLEDGVGALIFLVVSCFLGLFARSELHSLQMKRLQNPGMAHSSKELDEDYPGIYRITCSANGMQYVGMTSRPIKERWRDHLSDLNAGRHHNDRMQHDWNLYRPEVFTWEILEVVTDQVWLRDRERYWQNKDYETSKRYNPPNTPRIIRSINKRPKRNK